MMMTLLRAELAKEEAALQELLRLRREEEEAARKAAAEGNEVDRLEHERKLPLSHRHLFISRG